MASIRTAGLTKDFGDPEGCRAVTGRERTATVLEVTEGGRTGSWCAYEAVGGSIRTRWSW